MKVVFLDFDGVLTSEAYTRQCIFEYRRENMFGMDWFDPFCLKMLQRIVDATGAGIVVSSSWRELGEDKLKRLWDEIPMPGTLLGSAPEWILTKDCAIWEYLKLHPCEKYVILDDDDLHLPNQVKTYCREGLTEANAQEAINTLNG